eukprot:15454-Eustigmatos_ZCMA.PRE.1
MARSGDQRLRKQERSALLAMGECGPLADTPCSWTFWPSKEKLAPGETGRPKNTMRPTTRPTERTIVAR